MNKSIPDNSRFTISDQEALEAVRAFNLKCAEYAAHEEYEEATDDPRYRAAIQKEGIPPDFLPGWEEDVIAGARFNLAYQRGVQLQEMRARARARTALHARHYRSQTRVTRVRARRSPASTRRATADSGGDDGGGSGDPEPPRPRCNVSQIFCGGASL
jgi:hypothetical protein